MGNKDKLELNRTEHEIHQLSIVWQDTQIRLYILLNSIFDNNWETPFQYPLPYFTILNFHNEFSIFTYGGIDYPFGNFKERSATNKKITKLLKDSHETIYCEKNKFVELLPYPVVTTIQYPQYIYDTYGNNDDNGLSKMDSPILCINSKHIHYLLENNLIHSDNINKTIINLYKNKTSKKYVECRDFIISKMEDYCNIDEVKALDEIPKARALLYPNEPEIDKLPKWKRGNTDLFKIKLYDLTNKYIEENDTLSINKAVKDVYSMNKDTIFKDVNWGKGWDNDSLNGYYYIGKKRKKQSR